MGLEYCKHIGHIDGKMDRRKLRLIDQTILFKWIADGSQEAILESKT